MLVAFVIGFLFGFVGSMPVGGPVAILVFTRGIQGRMRSGIGIAVGASVSEAIYAFLAFWGFSELLVQHPWIEPVSRGIAMLILFGLGLHFTFRSGSHVMPDEGAVRARTGWAILLGFSISALNPILIATWSAAVATLHSTALVEFHAGLAFPFAVGACLGIAGWCILFLLLLNRYRRRFRLDVLDRILRATGVCVIGLGVYFTVRFVQYWT